MLVRIFSNHIIFIFNWFPILIYFMSTSNIILPKSHCFNSCSLIQCCYYKKFYKKYFCNNIVSDINFASSLDRKSMLCADISMHSMLRIVNVTLDLCLTRALLFLFLDTNEMEFHCKGKIHKHQTQMAWREYNNIHASFSKGHCPPVITMVANLRCT